jgi:hypothetical protein
MKSDKLVAGFLLSYALTNQIHLLYLFLRLFMPTTMAKIVLVKPFVLSRNQSPRISEHQPLQGKHGDLC